MQRRKPGKDRDDILKARKMGKKEYMAEHTLTADETLSHLSLKYYESAAKDKWMIIYEANKDVIGDNPNNLRLGTKLNIPE